MYKGRFIGKQLVGGFTGPKKGGQGSQHGKVDRLLLRTEMKALGLSEEAGLGRL